MKALSVLALLTLPVSAFCVIFSKEIVDLLLGPKWHTAVVPFAILSGALYFSLAWRSCATLFQALGHPSWVTGVLICRAGALIAGIWWAAPHGLTAICVVVAVVMALMLAIILIIVKHAIDLPLRRVAERISNPSWLRQQQVVFVSRSGHSCPSSGPGPGHSDASLAPIFIFCLRLFQPGAHPRL